MKRTHFYDSPKGIIFGKSLAEAATFAESKHIHSVSLLQTECLILGGNRIFKVTITSNNGYEDESFFTYATGHNAKYVADKMKYSDYVDCSTTEIKVEETNLKVFKV